MVLASLGTGLSRSNVNTADCASHFLCEENHKQAQLHLHEKPHRPTDFPEVSFDQKYIGFPASYVMAKIAICFLNFRITVDKSISQPLVIGVIFPPKMISFTHFPLSSILFCHLAATSFNCKNNFFFFTAIISPLISTS